MKSPLYYYRLGRLVDRAWTLMGYVDAISPQEAQENLARYQKRSAPVAPPPPRPRTLEDHRWWVAFARRENQRFKAESPEFPHD